MSDPLSITSGVIAILTVSKELYSLIDRIKKAPDVLKSAQLSLSMTTNILDELRNHLQSGQQIDDANGQRHALKLVLETCLQSCEAFKALISGLVKNPDGEVTILDRARLVSKEKSIIAFREEISLTRECVTITVASLTLTTTTKSQSELIQLAKSAQTTKAAIESRLHSIETTLQILATPLDAQAIVNLISTLKAQLALCTSTLTTLSNAAQSTRTTYHATFQNTKTGLRAKTIVGLVAKALPQDIRQECGDSDLGDESISFIGVGDSETVLGFFKKEDAGEKSGDDGAERQTQVGYVVRRDLRRGFVETRVPSLREGGVDRDGSHLRGFSQSFQSMY